MSEVVLQGVSKTYPGEVVAVEACDLRIPDGQFTVLVGPSGCGKSTMLRMIAGLESVSQGTIQIGSREVNHVPPKDRNVAMVFQDYALYPHLTVDRNLRFPLEQRRRTSLLKSCFSLNARRARRMETSAIDARVNEVVDKLGISAYRDRLPRSLSGGQRQRVALGRALVRDPAVFLLDEPLSNLDVNLRLDLRTELKQVHRLLGATMIHVTHDQEEAMALGEVLIVMREGVIRQVGTPVEIYNQPADRFVASFVGTPPMNFMETSMVDGSVDMDQHESIEMNSAYEGTVVLGIRPEAVRVGSGPYQGSVTAVEQLGDRMMVSMQAFGVKLAALVDGSVSVRTGINCLFDLDRSGLHVFQSGICGARIA